MSYGGPAPRSSSNAWLIILVIGLLSIFGCGVLVVVCLAAITAIGTKANAEFKTVGSSLSAGPTTGTDTPRVDLAVREVLDLQVAAWNEGNLEGFMQGYWNSPELSFYTEDTPKRGWQETYARYKERYQAEGKEMGRLSFSDLKIDPLSSDRALVRGRWKVVFQKGEAEGLFTLVMQKFPEGWRITHDHTSAKPPKKE